MNRTAEPRLSNSKAKKVPHSTQITHPVKIDMTGGGLWRELAKVPVYFNSDYLDIQGKNIFRILSSALLVVWYAIWLRSLILHY